MTAPDALPGMASARVGRDAERTYRPMRKQSKTMTVL